RTARQGGTQLSQGHSVFGLVAPEQRQQPRLESIDRLAIGLARLHRVGRGQRGFQRDGGPVLVPQVGGTRQRTARQRAQGFVLGEEGKGRHRLAVDAPCDVVDQG